MCGHHLGGEPDGLTCTRTTDHDPAATGGHTYTASNGSDVADRHDATSGGEH